MLHIISKSHIPMNNTMIFYSIKSLLLLMNCSYIRWFLKSDAFLTEWRFLESDPFFIERRFLASKIFIIFQRHQNFISDPILDLILMTQIVIQLRFLITYSFFVEKFLKPNAFFVERALFETYSFLIKWRLFESNALLIEWRFLKAYSFFIERNFFESNAFRQKINKV